MLGKRKTNRWLAFLLAMIMVFGSVLPTSAAAVDDPVDKSEGIAAAAEDDAAEAEDGAEAAVEDDAEVPEGDEAEEAGEADEADAVAVEKEDGAAEDDAEGVIDEGEAEGADEAAEDDAEASEGAEGAIIGNQDVDLYGWTKPLEHNYLFIRLEGYEQYKGAFKALRKDADAYSDDGKIYAFYLGSGSGADDDYLKTENNRLVLDPDKFSAMVKDIVDNVLEPAAFRQIYLAKNGIYDDSDVDDLCKSMEDIAGLDGNVFGAFEAKPEPEKFFNLTVTAPWSVKIPGTATTQDEYEIKGSGGEIFGEISFPEGDGPQALPKGHKLVLEAGTYAMSVSCSDYNDETPRDEDDWLDLVAEEKKNADTGEYDYGESTQPFVLLDGANANSKILKGSLLNEERFGSIQIRAYIEGPDGELVGGGYPFAEDPTFYAITAPADIAILMDIGKTVPEDDEDEDPLATNKGLAEIKEGKNEKNTRGVISNGYYETPYDSEEEEFSPVDYDDTLGRDTTLHYHPDNAYAVARGGEESILDDLMDMVSTSTGLFGMKILASTDKIESLIEEWDGYDDFIEGLRDEEEIPEGFVTVYDSTGRNDSPGSTPWKLSQNYIDKLEQDGIAWETMVVYADRKSYDLQINKDSGFVQNYGAREYVNPNFYEGSDNAQVTVSLMAEQNTAGTVTGPALPSADFGKGNQEELMWFVNVSSVDDGNEGSLVVLNDVPKPAEADPTSNYVEATEGTIFFNMKETSESAKLTFVPVSEGLVDVTVGLYWNGHSAENWTFADEGFDPNAADLVAMETFQIYVGAVPSENKANFILQDVTDIPGAGDKDDAEAISTRAGLQMVRYGSYGSGEWTDNDSNHHDIDDYQPLKKGIIENLPDSYKRTLRIKLNNKATAITPVYIGVGDTPSDAKQNSKDTADNENAASTTLKLISIDGNAQNPVDYGTKSLPVGDYDMEFEVAAKEQDGLPVRGYVYVQVGTDEENSWTIPVEIVQYFSVSFAIGEGQLANGFDVETDGGQQVKMWLPAGTLLANTLVKDFEGWERYFTIPTAGYDDFVPATFTPVDYVTRPYYDGEGNLVDDKVTEVLDPDGDLTEEVPSRLKGYAESGAPVIYPEEADVSIENTEYSNYILNSLYDLEEDITLLVTFNRDVTPVITAMTATRESDDIRKRYTKSMISGAGDEWYLRNVGNFTITRYGEEHSYTDGAFAGDEPTEAMAEDDDYALTIHVEVEKAKPGDYVQLVMPVKGTIGGTEYDLSDYLQILGQDDIGGRTADNKPIPQIPNASNNDDDHLADAEFLPIPLTVDENGIGVGEIRLTSAQGIAFEKLIDFGDFDDESEEIMITDAAAGSVGLPAIPVTAQVAYRANQTKRYSYTDDILSDTTDDNAEQVNFSVNIAQKYAMAAKIDETALKTDPDFRSLSAFAKYSNVYFYDPILPEEPGEVGGTPVYTAPLDEIGVKYTESGLGTGLGEIQGKIAGEYVEKDDETVEERFMQLYHVKEGLRVTGFYIALGDPGNDAEANEYPVYAEFDDDGQLVGPLAIIPNDSDAFDESPYSDNEPYNMTSDVVFTPIYGPGVTDLTFVLDTEMLHNKKLDGANQVVLEDPYAVIGDGEYDANADMTVMTVENVAVGAEITANIPDYEGNDDPVARKDYISAAALLGNTSGDLKAWKPYYYRVDEEGNEIPLNIIDYDDGNGSNDGGADAGSDKPSKESNPAVEVGDVIYVGAQAPVRFVDSTVGGTPDANSTIQKIVADITAKDAAEGARWIPGEKNAQNNPMYYTYNVLYGETLPELPATLVSQGSTANSGWRFAGYMDTSYSIVTGDPDPETVYGKYYYRMFATGAEGTVFNEATVDPAHQVEITPKFGNEINFVHTLGGANVTYDELPTGPIIIPSNADGALIAEYIEDYLPREYVSGDKSVYTPKVFLNEEKTVLADGANVFDPDLAIEKQARTVYVDWAKNQYQNKLVIAPVDQDNLVGIPTAVWKENAGYEGDTVKDLTENVAFNVILKNINDNTNVGSDLGVYLKLEGDPEAIIVSNEAQGTELSKVPSGEYVGWYQLSIASGGNGNQIYVVPGGGGKEITLRAVVAGANLGDTSDETILADLNDYYKIQKIREERWFATLVGIKGTGEIFEKIGFNDVPLNSTSVLTTPPSFVVGNTTLTFNEKDLGKTNDTVYRYLPIKEGTSLVSVMQAIDAQAKSSILKNLGPELQDQYSPKASYIHPGDENLKGGYFYTNADGFDKEIVSAHFPVAIYADGITAENILKEGTFADVIVTKGTDITGGGAISVPDGGGNQLIMIEYDDSKVSLKFRPDPRNRALKAQDWSMRAGERWSLLSEGTDMGTYYREGGFEPKEYSDYGLYLPIDGIDSKDFEASYAEASTAGILLPDQYFMNVDPDWTPVFYTYNSITGEYKEITTETTDAHLSADGTKLITGASQTIYVNFKTKVTLKGANDDPALDPAKVEQRIGTTEQTLEVFHNEKIKFETSGKKVKQPAISPDAAEQKVLWEGWRILNQDIDDWGNKLGEPHYDLFDPDEELIISASPVIRQSWKIPVVVDNTVLYSDDEFTLIFGNDDELEYGKTFEYRADHKDGETGLYVPYGISVENWNEFLGDATIYMDDTNTKDSRNTFVGYTCFTAAYDDDDDEFFVDWDEKLNIYDTEAGKIEDNDLRTGAMDDEGVRQFAFHAIPVYVINDAPTVKLTVAHGSYPKVGADAEASGIESAVAGAGRFTGQAMQYQYVIKPDQPYMANLNITKGEISRMISYDTVKYAIVGWLVLSESSETKTYTGQVIDEKTLVLSDMVVEPVFVDKSATVTVKVSAGEIGWNVQTGDMPGVGGDETVYKAPGSADGLIEFQASVATGITEAQIRSLETFLYPETFGKPYYADNEKYYGFEYVDGNGETRWISAKTPLNVKTDDGLVPMGGNDIGVKNSYVKQGSFEEGVTLTAKKYVYKRDVRIAPNTEQLGYFISDEMPNSSWDWEGIHDDEEDPGVIDPGMIKEDEIETNVTTLAEEDKDGKATIYDVSYVAAENDDEDAGRYYGYFKGTVEFTNFAEKDENGSPIWRGPDKVYANLVNYQWGSNGDDANPEKGEKKEDFDHHLASILGNTKDYKFSGWDITGNSETDVPITRLGEDFGNLTIYHYDDAETINADWNEGTVRVTYNWDGYDGDEHVDNEATWKIDNYGLIQGEDWSINEGKVKGTTFPENGTTREYDRSDIIAEVEATSQLVGMQRGAWTLAYWVDAAGTHYTFDEPLDHDVTVWPVWVVEMNVNIKNGGFETGDTLNEENISKDGKLMVPYGTYTFEQLDELIRVPGAEYDKTAAWIFDGYLYENGEITTNIGEKAGQKDGITLNLDELTTASGTITMNLRYRVLVTLKYLRDPGFNADTTSQYTTDQWVDGTSRGRANDINTRFVSIIAEDPNDAIEVLDKWGSNEALSLGSDTTMTMLGWYTDESYAPGNRVETEAPGFKGVTKNEAVMYANVRPVDSFITVTMTKADQYVAFTNDDESKTFYLMLNKTDETGAYVDTFADVFESLTSLLAPEMKDPMYVFKGVKYGEDFAKSYRIGDETADKLLDVAQRGAKDEMVLTLQAFTELTMSKVILRVADANASWKMEEIPEAIRPAGAKADMEVSFEMSADGNFLVIDPALFAADGTYTKYLAPVDGFGFEKWVYTDGTEEKEITANTVTLPLGAVVTPVLMEAAPLKITINGVEIELQKKDGAYTVDEAVLAGIQVADYDGTGSFKTGKWLKADGTELTLPVSASTEEEIKALVEGIKPEYAAPEVEVWVGVAETENNWTNRDGDKYTNKVQGTEEVSLAEGSVLEVSCSYKPESAKNYLTTDIKATNLTDNGDGTYKAGKKGVKLVFTTSYSNTAAGSGQIKAESGKVEFSASVAGSSASEYNFADDAEQTGKFTARFANEDENEKQFIYTGKPIKPEVIVNNGEKTMVQGVDYTVSYKKNTKAGDPAVAVIKGKGLYSKTLELPFTIVAKNMDNTDVEEGMPQVKVGGLVFKTSLSSNTSKIKPVVSYYGKVLGKKDYTLTFGEFDSEEKTMTVTIAGTGNFQGSTEATVSFADQPQKIKVAWKKDVLGTYVFNGNPADLIEKKAFTVNGVDPDPETVQVAYSENVAAGTVTVVVTADGYAGSAKKSFKLKQLENPAVEVTNAEDLEAVPFVSAGAKPYVALSLADNEEYGEMAGAELVYGRDYKLSWKNNKNAGTGTATITFMGNYKGKTTQSFTIAKAEIDTENSIFPATIALNAKKTKGSNYYLKQNKNLVVMTTNGYALANAEYQVKFMKGESELGKSDAVAAGDEITVVILPAKKAQKAANVNIPADGIELGTYTIVDPAGKTDISAAKAKFMAGGKKAKIGYTGAEIVLGKSAEEMSENGLQAYIEATLKKASIDLKEGFDVRFANNRNKGKATVIITADEDNATYVGSFTATFSIGAHVFAATDLAEE